MNPITCFNSSVELPEKPDRPCPGAPLRAIGNHEKLLGSKDTVVVYGNHIFEKSYSLKNGIPFPHSGNMKIKIT